jgi:carboxyl-terminal processing protease
MKKRFLLLICLTSLTVFAVAANLSFAKESNTEEITPRPLAKEDIFKELEIFADAIVLINSNYVEEEKPKKLIYGALEGMLSSLDSHSGFLTPQEYKDIRAETAGEFGGIGIQVTMRDKTLTVISPLEGTPAYKAGILPGDKIIKVDDESTEDLTLDEVVEKMRGIPGTDVKLTIIREGEDRIREFVIKRDIIKVRSIKDTLSLGEGIGYIKILEFQQHTSDELTMAIKKLLKDEAKKGLILDLRNNPGGLLDTAISAAELFLKKDSLIVSTKGRNPQQSAVLKSQVIRPYIGFPMVVLVNRGSASGSEILAAALKDNKRAVIVGEKTFGKGSVQIVMPLKDGSAVRLTTSLYVTPAGNIINDKGVDPDIEIKGSTVMVDKDDEGLEKDKLTIEKLKADNQVKAAIDLLKDRERYKAILDKKS